MSSLDGLFGCRKLDKIEYIEAKVEMATESCRRC